MKISKTCIGILALVGSACGSPDGLDSSPAEESLAGTEAEDGATLETLHHFEVQGSTYTYLSDGDDVLLSVRTSRSARRLEVETSTGAAPTFLELFNALQPGVEPHELLVASHRDSARLLGRANDSVLPALLVDSELSEVVAKTAADLADCRSFFLPVWGGGFGGGVPVVTSLEGTAAGTTVQASTASVANKFMAAGACNFAATQARVVAFDKRINAAGAWVAQLTVNLAVNDANYIVHSPSAQVVNLRSRMVDAANLGMQLVAARRQ